MALGLFREQKLAIVNREEIDDILRRALSDLDDQIERLEDEREREKANWIQKQIGFKGG